MKTTTSSILADIRHAFRQFVRLGTEAGNIIAALPWPALMAAAILLAFVFTLLPLVITLFLVFLLVKLIVNALSPRQQHHLGD